MRKIAMVGTTKTGERAPFHDESWEIWGVSNRNKCVTRATRWFELHRLDGEPEGWANAWRVKMKDVLSDIPELYMMYPEFDVHPSVKVYPHERIIDRFGTFFMTSTFSWMMALAIDELRPLGGKPVPGRIAIYGVEMEYGTEYRQQRAGLRHFMALAEFAGIPVGRLADGGLAMEPVPYPMWQDDPQLNKFEARKKESHEALESLNRTRGQTKRLAAENLALLRELKQMEERTGFKGVGKYVASRSASLHKELNALEDTLDKLDIEMATLRGQHEEQCFVLDYLQP